MFGNRMSKVLALAIASPTNAPSVRIFFCRSSGWKGALLYAQRPEHCHEETVAVLYRLALDHRRELLPVFHPTRHGCGVRELVRVRLQKAYGGRIVALGPWIDAYAPR
jgi:hypothetical protein